jgi:molybdopterin-guanine dinucleotide biosynthesis protein A
MSLAVDTPFFPHDFVARALPLAAGVDAVIGCFGAQDYPTNALWRLAALRDLPRALRDGTAPHSLKRLAASLKSVRLDYAAVTGDDPFLNANTPQDLAFLRNRGG